MLGPNCMGVAAPAGAAAWIGTVPETAAPGHVAAVSQSGSIGEALLNLGGRVGFRCVVSSGGEAVTDAADFLAYFAEDEETRAVGPLPRDRAPAGGVRRRARSRRCGGEARRLPQDRPLAGRRARRARPHRGARRLRPRVLGAARALRGDRGRRLPRAGRDPGDPGPAPAASRTACGRDLRVRRRGRAARRPRRGRGNPVRAAPGRARRGALRRVPELPLAGEPARRLGGRGRERGLPALARAAWPARTPSTSCSRRSTSRSSAAPRSRNGT